MVDLNPEDCDSREAVTGFTACRLLFLLTVVRLTWFVLGKHWSGWKPADVILEWYIRLPGALYRGYASVESEEFGIVNAVFSLGVSAKELCLKRV